MTYQMLKKVKDFRVIFGESEKGIMKKQNGCKILRRSREMIKHLPEKVLISVEK